MNKKYFNDSEANDMKRLRHFNQYLHLQDLNEAPTKHFYDASGCTTDGRYLAMELKERNQNLVQTDNGYIISGCSNNGTSYTGDTIMIETHKAASMYFDAAINNHIPMYINFLNDGIVVCFNLNRLSTMPTSGERKIKSKGYGAMEIGIRAFLHLNDAWIYHWSPQNNKYETLQKPK